MNTLQKTLKNGTGIAYTPPVTEIFHIVTETGFLVNTNTPGRGSIPTLDEGDVPDDLWS